MKKLTFLALAGLLMVAIFTGCSATSRYYSMPTIEFEDLDYFFPVEHVAVRNLDIAYIDQGPRDGDVLLLVHGLGSNAKGWVKQIEELRDDYRVIALDLPGYFKSSKGYYPYSMSWYALVLTEFLDALNIEQATFAGHSMGGQISMHAALAFPERVKNLILIDPAGFEKFNEGESDWFREVATPELTILTPERQIDKNLRSNFYETPEDAEFMIRDRIAVRKAEGFELYAYAVARNIKGMVNEPVWPVLDRIEHRTLIIFGEQDMLIPNPYLHGGFTREIAEYGHSRMPNSTLVMVPEAGHFSQFEKPQVVNAAIREFLR